MTTLLNPNTYPPAADSSDNVFLRDVIGTKTDTHSGDSIRALLKLINEHAHKPQKCYPVLADSVTLIASASSWVMGSWTELIPADTITEDFDIHWVNISNISANDEYEIEFGTGGAGSEVSLDTCVSFERNAVQSQEGSTSIQTGLISANTRVAARLASKATAANTANIKVHYHEY